ncbi:Uncharacterised protein [Klebsiella pneumoniae]|nr:Uncharacterised protein [Klebsiella pneumoniae]
MLWLKLKNTMHFWKNNVHIVQEPQFWTHQVI